MLWRLSGSIRAWGLRRGYAWTGGRYPIYASNEGHIGNVTQSLPSAKTRSSCINIVGIKSLNYEIVHLGRISRDSYVKKENNTAA